jgi:hypothetical protein
MDCAQLISALKPLKEGKYSIYSLAFLIEAEAN